MIYVIGDRGYALETRSRRTVVAQHWTLTCSCGLVKQSSFLAGRRDIEAHARKHWLADLLAWNLA